nr:unnamed protein product [Callosobruchus analis]
MESDEEHFDDRSPVGQIITDINKLCKKPKIDDQLQKAIQRFNAHMQLHKVYLANGVYNINFVEAALFIQSCTILYGKKIDVLWDEILAFHTRLIQYDCDHAKKKGTKPDVEVIKKLEERRNRYKRKKLFKLLIQEQTEPDIELFDPPQPELRYEYDYDMAITWRSVIAEANYYTGVPRSVFRQQAKRYRLRNNKVLECLEEELMDMDDDEFNTKYSRVPSWQFIKRLIDYNDQGLLPDKQKCLAKLKLMMYGRLKFMEMKEIPLNTPYREYANEYQIYRQNFFEEEAQKWQNMPLDTMDDLRIIHCCDDSEGSDNDSETELPQPDLYVNLEQLSSEVINTKLRQDSGYYDFEEVADAEGTVEQVEGQGQNMEQTEGQEASVAQSEGQTEGQSQNMEQTEGQDASVAQSEGQSQDKEQTEGQGASIAQSEGQTEGQCQDKEENVGDIQDKKQSEGIVKSSTSEAQDKQHPAQVEGQTAGCSTRAVMDTPPPPELLPYYAFDRDDNVDDCRSIVSDHDYCADAPNTILGELIRSRNGESIAKKMAREMPPPPLTPVFGGSRIFPKPIRLKQKRAREPKQKQNEGPMKKVRKLSQKQLEKLKNNLVIAEKVRLTKFEKFFARNYQTQMGEGETLEMSSDSESEALDFDEPPPEDHQNAETVSVMSEHSYCQPQQLDQLHDSGYHDDSQPDDSRMEVEPTAQEAELTAGEAGPTAQEAGPSGAAQGSGRSNSETEGRRRRGAVVDPMEEQIQETLRELRESIRAEDDEFDRRVAETIARKQMYEKERVESKKRVERWRSHITPILKNLTESEFDIHEYGSGIMKRIDVGEKKPFKDIVQGKPSSEVVRYFISTLQLANTGNIEICGAQPGRLSNETFEMKLLTTDRYHEHLSEFHAPSEAERKAKLKKMKEIRDKDQVEDQEEQDETHDDEPPAKQSRQSSRGKSPVNSTRCYRRSSRRRAETVSQEQEPPSDETSIETIQPPTSLSTAPSPVSTPLLVAQPIVTPQAPLRNAPPTFEADLATPSTSRAYFDEFLQSEPVDRQLFSTPVSDRPLAVGRGGPAPRVRHRLFDGRLVFSFERCFTSLLLKISRSKVDVHRYRKSSRRCAETASQEQEPPSDETSIETIQPPTSLYIAPSPVSTPLLATQPIVTPVRKSSRRCAETASHEQEPPSDETSIETIQPPTSLYTAPSPVSTPLLAIQPIVTPQAPLRNAPPTFEADLATPCTFRAYFDEFLQSEPVDRQLFSTPVSDRPLAVGRGGPAPQGPTPPVRLVDFCGGKRCCR